jgi:hypothetical protein
VGRSSFFTSSFNTSNFDLLGTATPLQSIHSRCNCQLLPFACRLPSRMNSSQAHFSVQCSGTWRRCGSQPNQEARPISCFWTALINEPIGIGAGRARWQSQPGFRVATIPSCFACLQPSKYPALPAALPHLEATLFESSRISNRGASSYFQLFATCKIPPSPSP